MATTELLNYGERDGKDVQDDGVLTLDACGCSARTEKVEDDGKRAEQATAGGGEDRDGGDESGLPSSIPWTRRWRATRRSFRPASICSGKSPAVAMPGGWRRFDDGHELGLGLGFGRARGEKGEGGERVSEGE